MLTINGRAGIGKTAMVCRLLKSLESGHLPDDLGEMSVDGIVYLSAIGTRTINTPNLFADLCHLLPTEISNQLDALYRDPKVSTTDKLLALLEKFSSGRVVVLLDNFESVVDDECCVKDAELDEALRALLRAPHHAVKIILTTRIAPHDLNLIEAGRQTMLHLDEGLESPFAENVLRECDADGKVGLKNAPADLLKCARERTRGFPRALEALYAILSADRYTALEEILGVQHPERSGVRPSTPLRSAQEAHAAQSKEVPLPENVVAALVGEAFSRLDPTAQKVMQGLAAYARPVPPAAVDYLLQPYLPSIDSALVLNRLVNMQFAHREAGKYYLHPADREYAWSRVLPLSPSPTRQDGESGSAGEGETSFTQRALLTRAADYFRDARKPRETWKTLADLEPQLNEFDLRCAAEDYDTAAYVLLEIDGNYLSLWGHYRLLVEMHERLQGKIADSDLKRRSRGNLGMTYEHTGQIPKAIASYEQALAMAREMKNRQAEGVWLGNLGDAYAALGQTARAIEFHKQALAIDREIGDKQGEGITLHWMGADSADMGQVFKAIEFYRQSLAIAREIKHQSNEAWAQGNLGTCFAMLAQYEYAIEMCQEALRIRHEIGDRRGEGYGTGELAEIVIDQGHYIEAIQLALESARIGEETSHPGISNRANRFLALAHFYSGNLPAARAAAEAARKYDEPTNSHNVLALLGIIALRQNDRAAAQEAFTTAIAHADALLVQTPQLYEALDAKGVALCGSGLCGGKGEAFANVDSNSKAAASSLNDLPSKPDSPNASPLQDAIITFRAARAINKDAGIVARVVRLLDALALAMPDGAETLAEARKVASGE